MDAVLYIVEQVLLFSTSFHIPLLVAELMICIAKYSLRRDEPISLVACCIIYASLHYAFFREPLYSLLIAGGWFASQFIVLFLLSILLIWRCFDLSLADALYIGAMGYSLQYIAYNLVTLLTTDIFAKVKDYGTIYSCLATMAGYLIVYMLFFCFCIKPMERQKIQYINTRYILCTTIITLLIVTVLSMQTLSGGYGQTKVYYIYGITCCCLLLGIQLGLFERGKLYHEKKIIEQLWRQDRKQYEMQKENIELINSKCHDMKKQLLFLWHLDHKDREELAQEIEGAVSIYDSAIKTGNPALDVILAEKGLLCVREQIRFTCMVDGQALRVMKAVDVYSLFGNALDNAIESVRKETSKEKRIIELQVIPKGKQLYIHMENYCADKLALKDGFPETSKTDRENHGYGMKSIYYCVEKYQGEMSFCVQDQMFCLDILLPME